MLAELAMAYLVWRANSSPLGPGFPRREERNVLFPPIRLLYEATGDGYAGIRGCALWSQCVECSEFPGI
jgi:hypothetical protein